MIGVELGRGRDEGDSGQDVDLIGEYLCGEHVSSLMIFSLLRGGSPIGAMNGNSLLLESSSCEITATTNMRKDSFSLPSVHKI